MTDQLDFGVNWVKGFSGHPCPWTHFKLCILTLPPSFTLLTNELVIHSV